MEPVVRLLGPENEILSEVTADGGVAALEYITDDDFEELFVSVAAGDDSPSPIGRYSVAITLIEDDFEDDDYDDFLRGGLFGLDDDVLRSLVSDDDDEIDLDASDIPGLSQAKRLLPVSTNAGQVWFEQLGSIVNENDTDVYIVETSEEVLEQPGVMTVRIQSLTLGGLIPDVMVHDVEGQLLSQQVVTHGNGELVVQVDYPEEEETVAITVSADEPMGSFAKGDYRMSVTVGSSRVELTEFSAGELSSATPIHAQLFHVSTPQLFHFLVTTASSTQGTSTAISMDIFDEQGQPVYALVTGANDVRSGANPLLQPGTYTLRVGPLNRSLQDQVAFQVTGVATSNPLGVVPVDPSQQPVFQCDGAAAQYCYPGHGPTENPFFWNHFIDQYQDQKPTNGPDTTLTDPSAHWWDWYLAESPNTPTGTPPITKPDEFRVRDGSLQTSADAGVLTNDHPASQTAVTAIAPQHGTLELSSDGSFVYVANPTFFGVDSFWYQAVENGSPSAPTRVSLIVSRGRRHERRRPSGLC